METAASLEGQIKALLSAHTIPPRIQRKDGAPLTAGEQKALVLRSENYTVESAGLKLLQDLWSRLRAPQERERFWEALKNEARHPLVPWFFVSQGKLLHLLEWIIDQMESEPLDQRVITMAGEALKLEHRAYSAQELEELGDLIGTLMDQSQMSAGQRSLAARQEQEADIAPNYMQSMRAKRDIYRALGILREIVRGAVYQRMEGMLSDI